jgi:hypothetical protein
MRRYLFILVSLTILTCSPARKYQAMPEVKAWEKDIVKFEQLDISETYPNDAIMFAGSSSIRLWSTLEQDMAPYQVIQRGYGGAKLSDFAVYASRIFAPHPCSAIVLFIGNDISATDQDKSPEEVAALFRDVLRSIRRTHRDTPVFWIAVTPSESRWKVWPEIQKAGKLIENICSHQKNTYFIRTDFAFLNESGLPRKEYFRSDKLHLNEDGYKVWTTIIKKELNKIVPQPNM